MTYSVKVAFMQRELDFLNGQLEIGSIYGYSYNRDGDMVVFFVYAKNC